MDTAAILRKAETLRALPPPGERRRIRERAGVSQEDVATALGVAIATVSRWESGRTPGDDTLHHYIQLLTDLRAINEADQ
jgi:DNA-binding transcriptional regulator YiaG